MIHRITEMILLLAQPALPEGYAQQSQLLVHDFESSQAGKINKTQCCSGVIKTKGRGGINIQKNKPQPH